MKLHVIYLAVICVASATGESAGSSQSEFKPIKANTEAKPKREAPVASESAYHGPSYKYLPPSPSLSTGSYESYSSGHHASYADSAALDFGGLGGGHDVGYSISKTPKVETFIVKTEPLHGYQSDEHSGGAEYKHFGSSNSYTGGYGKHQNSLGSSYAHHGHSGGHKYTTIAAPVHGFTASSHGGGVYNRFGGNVGGHGYSKGISGGGSHYASGGYAASSYSHRPSGFSSGGGGHGHSFGGSSSNHGGDAGYTYDIPVSTQSHVPSTVYGVPANDISPHYHVREPTTEHVQSPSYASGHKGLGHFGFVANRPQALHTNYIESGNSYSHHKAPFKPSYFLGASHASSGISDNGISGEYDGHSIGHGVSNQYLPPTSDGYDYPPPSALYDAPHYSQSGYAHSEPEPTYLPPQPHSSYLPPVTPGDSYLPPHH